MSNQDFDEIIKGKLKGLTEQKSDSDWFAFSELLKKEEAFADLDLINETKVENGSESNDLIGNQQNSDFDVQVSEKINSHETKYQENHWEALKARLEREESLRNNLYRTKLVEVVTILLLFFTFTSLYNVEFEKTAKADQTIFAHLYEKVKSSIDIDKSIAEVSEHVGSVIEKIKINRGVEEKFTKNITTEFAGNFQQTLPTWSNDSIEPVNMIINASTIKSDKSFSNLTNVTLSKLNKIETSFQALANDFPKLFLSEKIAQMKEASSTKFEFGTYVSQGIIGINSDYDEVYNMQGPTIILHNTKLGFTFAAGTDNLKIFAGIEKSSRTYAPPFIRETYGNSDIGYKNISLESIHQKALRIPLGVKYTPYISENRKHKISALINVGGNIITNASYDITDVRLAPSVRPDQTISSSRSNRIEPLLFNKSFEKGALNEGLVLENFYLDTGVDLAYERKITKNIDLAAGFSYAKFLGGSKIGPNKDKYDQYHIKLGINYTL